MSWGVQGFTMVCMRRLFMVSWILGAAVSSAWAGDNASFRLRNVAWQDLPEGTQNARFGPDGRLWLQTPDATNRERIADQFPRPVPRIGAKVMLFGPGKWVWFRGEASVRGYDGEKWASVPEPVRSAAAAAGRAFFAGEKALHIYDGVQWHRRPYALALLVSELDGKGVVAYRPGAHQLLRWRDGTWRSIAVVAPFNLATVRAVVPRPEGVWLVAKQRIEWLAYGVERKIPDWGLLLAALRRDGARGARAIVAHGAGALGMVETALETERSPETRRWLLGIRRTLRARAKTTRVVTFGRYRARDPELQWTDRGRLVFWSNRIVGPDFAGPGLLLFDGTWRVPRGRGFGRPWRFRDMAPVRMDARRFVLPAVESRGQMTIVDPTTGRVRARLNDPAYAFPVAAHASGYVVVRSRAGWHRSAPLAIWRPGAPDERVFLRTDSYPARAWCVSGGGSLFVVRGSGGVERFDGDRFLHVLGLSQRGTVRLFPGRGVSVAGMIGEGVLFLLAGRMGVSGGSRSMIEKHAAVIREEFRDAPIHWDSIHWAWGLTVTEDGRIWLYRGGKRDCWDGKTWTTDKPKKPDAATTSIAIDATGARWEWTKTGRLRRSRKNGTSALFHIRKTKPGWRTIVNYIKAGSGRLVFEAGGRLHLARLPE